MFIPCLRGAIREEREGGEEQEREDGRKEDREGGRDLREWEGRRGESKGGSEFNPQISVVDLF